MKRVVASKSWNGHDATYHTHTRNGQKFSIYMYNDDDPMAVRFSMSEIHPYDDAEYTWARYDNLVVEFIRGGKVVDKMHMHDYDEDYYETVYEYVTDLVDATAVELLNMNKDVKPRIVHN